MSWHYTYDPHIWPALITLAMVTALGWYSWHRRIVPGAKPFAIGCLFGALWAFGTVLEISAIDFSTRIFWVKFQTAWLVPVGTALPCFILVYAGLGRWLTRRILFLLAIPPLIFLGLILTNDYHQLVWTGFQLEESVVPSPGLANRVFLGYVYLLGLVNFTVLIWLAVRSPQHRQPALIMLSGQITGRGVYLLDYIYGGFLGPGESLLVVLGVITSAYGIAFFRFHVLDPVPAARTAVLEQMHEGMLVLDLQGRIADVNSAAARMLAKPASSLRGCAVTELLPVKLSDRPDKSGVAIPEFSLDSGKQRHYYSLSLTLLLDKYDRALGQLILLREITAEKQAREQILEHQRVVATLQERERLARELHDSTGQVLGYVNLQTETIRKWLRDGNPEKAESLLSRLAEVVKGAHTDIRESILSLKAGSGREWAFLPALKRYLDDFQTHHGIQTELVLRDGLRKNSFSPDAEVQLLRVIQEAMVNAYKHSGASLVRINIGQEDGLGQITVTDNGAGFDPARTGQETGRHFGLTFMRERMAQIGGRLEMDSRLGEGTVIKLEAPLREHQEEIE